MPEPTPDHRQCRHLKMDGVRCHNQIPLGHSHCYHHRNNRNPSFVRHKGKIRIPLLEDVSALQVTTTAALHALLNHSLDLKEVRTVLYGVNTAARVLRIDLAEKHWLHQTGQSRPEPVVDFAVIGHEHVAQEDSLTSQTSAQASNNKVADPEPCALSPEPCALSSDPRALSPEPCALRSSPCSSLDPEDHFLTPETFRPFDEKMRIPLPAPGEHDPLRIDDKDWPCPYRFNYCKGPGPKASCHYCSGALRWEDVHPGEPDPGAPGPLPTVLPDWTFSALRDIAAPRVLRGAPSPSPSFGDSVGDQNSEPESDPGAPSLSPSFGDRVGSHDSEPEFESDIAVLVASAEELPARSYRPQATGYRLPGRYQCAPAESATSLFEASLLAKVDEAAIEGVISARDEAGLIRAEPNRQARNFIGFGHPSDGLRLTQFLHHFAFATRIISRDESVHKRSVDARRRDCIAANPISNVVAGHGIGHRQHSAFTGGIGKTVRQAGHGGDGGHIQNDSATLLLHGFDDGADTEINTAHIDAHYPIEVVVRGTAGRAHMGHTSGIDKDMDLPALCDRSKGTLDARPIGNVAGQRLRPATGGHDVLHRLGRGRFVQIDEEDRRPAQSKSLGNGQADSAGAACNDGCPAA